MKAWVVTCAFLMCAGAMPASAQHMNAPDAPCRTVMSAACFGAAAEQADAELNTLRQDIAVVLDSPDQARFQETERAWLAYRASFCTAEYDLYDGGSGGPTARLACMEALTRHHAAELKAAYGWRLEKFGHSRRADR